MKRHMELIQQVLEWSEERCDGSPVDVPRVCNHDAKAVHYHVGLCQDAGYLRAEKISGAEEPYPRFAIGPLTWAGHEALERLRAP